jgi:hypothetical protein
LSGDCAELTVLANGCYRWLAKQLHGFETAAPKQLFRKFVETRGTIEIEKDRIVVHFDKRCHNPILREAALDRPSQKIPWLQNLPVVSSTREGARELKMWINFRPWKSALSGVYN